MVHSPNCAAAEVASGTQFVPQRLYAVQREMQSPVTRERAGRKVIDGRRTEGRAANVISPSDQLPKDGLAIQRAYRHMNAQRIKTPETMEIIAHCRKQLRVESLHPVEEIQCLRRRQELAVVSDIPDFHRIENGSQLWAQFQRMRRG